MDNPIWASEDKFKSMECRFKNQDELDSNIEKWTATMYAYDVMKNLQRLAVPAGVVQNPIERVHHDPQLKHRGFFAEAEHAELGTTKVEAIPMKMSNTPVELKSASPLLGEHTPEIYLDLLGVSPDELATFYEEGIA